MLFSFQNENARKLTEWAATLKKPSDEATFFNFLDSHDGVGVMAVQGILTPEEIEMMALKVVEHGGFISYKANPDGSQSPYELNITWFSAINNEDADEPMEIQIKRYIASRAIALVMMGVPGIYLHGFLGSKTMPIWYWKNGKRVASIAKPCAKRIDPISGKSANHYLPCYALAGSSD